MKRARSILIVLLLACSVGTAQERLLTDSLFAPSIGTVKRFSVLAPGQFEPGKRYPVLYLLHGLDGDYTDWTKHTGLREEAGHYQIIIVMPDGGNSWYVNAIDGLREKFDDYLSVDLQAYVQTHYPVDPARQGIAGLSMGGYGALIQALRHPTQYFFAGSLSGGANVPRDIESRGDGLRMLPAAWNLKRIFGDSTSGARVTYDLLKLCSAAAPDSLPYLYLAIGTQDPLPGFLKGNRELVAALRERRIPYEYRETPGSHTWRYWDREVRPLLARFAEVLQTGYRPVAARVGEAITRSGIETGRSLFAQLIKDPASQLSEGDMNDLGYRLLHSGKAAAALEVFKLSAGVFPSSSDVQSGLGNCYAASGDTMNAIRAFRIALSLNPDDAKQVSARLKALQTH